jgi:uracil-DNA glycosylase
MCSNESYALKSFEEQERRRAMLNNAYMLPLENFLRMLRSEYPDKQIPCFDPCDGGIKAKSLFFLEAPGPKATESNFISRNNPDQTAKNMNDLMIQSNIVRKDTLLWNIVPWYVGDGKKIRPVTHREIKEALPYVQQLLELLPDLKVIVLVGRKAQKAEEHLRKLISVEIVKTFHPSPLVFNLHPNKKQEAYAQFKIIAELMSPHYEA